MTSRNSPFAGDASPWPTLIQGLALALLLSTGCSGEQPPPAAAPEVHATRISAIAAGLTDVEVTEPVVGELEAMIVPRVAAEVPGRILHGFTKAGETVVPGQVMAELDTENYEIAARGVKAELNQLVALRANQQKTVTRYAELMAKKLISTDQFDTAKTELRNLDEQVKATEERLKQSQRSLTKTRILAPYGGIVDAELISPGDFVKVGVPLFRIVQISPLRIRLPLPEAVANRVAVGQTVRAVSPLDSATTVTGTISEIRPTVGRDNRAINCFVIVDNPGTWKPGGSVAASIVLGARRNAVVVPEAAVVQRPAGSVVYAIEDGVAKQRVVRTGEFINGNVELLSGLQAGAIVAVDGAGFLTDGAPVTITNAGQP